MLNIGRISTWIFALVLAASTVSLGVLAQDEAISDNTNETAGVDEPVETGILVDAGIDAMDAGARETVADEPSEERAADSEAQKTPNEKASSKDRRAWRRDPSIPRRPGSYLGGGFGYTMAFSRFTNKQRDFITNYEIGPIHASNTTLRAGDAFFEWLAVGFQVTINNGALMESIEEKTAGFGLYLDTSLYPWRGFGIRPAIGLGFAYSQAGPESYKLGFGGPLSLSISLTYEGRITRFITLGPVVQLSWIRGEDFDVMYLTFGIELLKWFRTAEG